MSQQITILIQDATLLRGTERAAISLANSLASFGHSVTVLSIFSSGQPLAYALSPDIQVKHLKQAREVHGSNLRRALKLLRVAWALRRNVARGSVIISSEDMLSLAALLARLGRGNAVLSWQHLRYWDTYPLVMLLRKLFFRFLDGVVVLNRDDRQDFETLGLQRVTVIPNINSFSDILPSNSLNRRLIAVGANVPEKGFDRLLSDAAPVMKAHPDWTLSIVGRDVPGSELITLTERAGLTRQVLLQAPTHDISSEYLKASICVVTSYRESFNLVIIEAKSRGLPTVAYDCPSGPRELITDGIDGYLVKDGDVAAFQERLAALMEDRALLERMGQAAAVSAQRYSAASVYTLWTTLLDEL